jgi:transcriptional regulator CtsR
MLYAVILLLTEKGLFTEEEAKLLIEKFKASALPADYDSAKTNVKRILKDVEQDLAFLEP